MAISMLDIYFYSCIVLGEFSNVKDADVNAPEYEGAVMQCSNIAYKPGQSSINNYRSIDSMIDPPTHCYRTILTGALTLGSQTAM